MKHYLHCTNCDNVYPADKFLCPYCQRIEKLLYDIDHPGREYYYEINNAKLNK